MSERALEYRILKEAVNILQRIEEGHWDFLQSHPSQLKLRLIRLIQLLTTHLWQQPSPPHDSIPFQSSKVTPNVIFYIYQCLQFFTQSISMISSKEINYFGIFEPSIYQMETEIVIEFFNILIDGYDHPNSMYHSMYRLFLCLPLDSEEEIITESFQTNNKNNANNSNNNDYDFRNCLFLKLFWIKFFQYQLVINWSDFIQVFIDFYTSGTSNSTMTTNSNATSFTSSSNGGGVFHDSLQTFKRLLLQENEDIPAAPPCTPQTYFSDEKDKNSSETISCGQFLELSKLQDFCYGYTSLFQAFQAKCDPEINVYLSGCILENVVDYKVPTIIKSLLGMKIASVACGDQHVAVITETGGLLTWGKGQFGRLGHGTETDVAEPTVVATLSNVPLKAVSCGFAYTFAISHDGKLFSWGAGGNGRLGHGNEVNTFWPMMVRSFINETAKSVCAGSVHTCILTEEGKVFTCGKAAYAGHGEREDALQPTWLNKFDGIKVQKISVATGGFHSLVLTVDQKVYSWGHNRVGQLGLISTGMERYDDGGLFLPTPERVSYLPDNIVDIDAGWGHSSVVTEDGDVYMCGRNVEGQLGMKDPHLLPVNERGHRYQPVFTLVKEGDLSNRKVWNVGCGGEHTIFFCGNHDIIGVGQSHLGQLGRLSSSAAVPRSQSSINYNYEPPKLLPQFLLEKRQILQVCCSYNCTVVLVGKRNPPSLRKLCSDILRLNPDLFINNSEEEEAYLQSQREPQSQKEGAEEEEECRKRSSSIMKVEGISNDFKELIRSLLL